MSAPETACPRRPPYLRKREFQQGCLAPLADCHLAWGIMAFRGAEVERHPRAARGRIGVRREPLRAREQIIDTTCLVVRDSWRGTAGNGSAEVSNAEAFAERAIAPAVGRGGIAGPRLWWRNACRARNRHIAQHDSPRHEGGATRSQDGWGGSYSPPWWWAKERDGHRPELEIVA